MSVSIRLKHSAVAAKAPLPTDLADGELGLNINSTAPAVYLKDSSGAVVKVGGQGTEPDATETVKGIAEVATQAEVDAGTDDARIVTPLKLATAVPAATEALAGKAEIATQGEVITGTDDTRIITPLKLATAVPAASTTAAGKAELATQAEVTAGTDNTKIVTPLTATTTFVNVAGDTMTGDLIAPNVNATSVVTAGDHMEGVYASQLFEVIGVTGAQSVEFAIPAWCRKIEIEHLDWNSTGAAKGTSVAYWQFLDGSDGQYSLIAAGSRYGTQWGAGFAGTDDNLANASAEVYMVPAPCSHSGSITIAFEKTLVSTENRFRCIWNSLGTYSSGGSMSTYMQSGSMTGAATDTVPAKIRLGTYQTSTAETFLGKVRFYS